MITREKIQEKLKPLMGGLSFIGESVRFFKNGEVVGEIELPELTTGEARHVLAELAEVDEYDDFWFVKGDDVRLKASESFIDGMKMHGSDMWVDLKTNIGEYSNVMYQKYKTAKVCEHCGNKTY